MQWHKFQFPMRAFLLTAAKLAIGVTLLTVVAARTPLPDAMSSLKALPSSALVVAVILYFTAHGLNALKLRLFLPELTILQAWRFTMIAVLYGMALPGPVAGDAVKALRLARAADSAGDMGAAVAAVGVDKVIGMFALLLLMALSIGLDTAAFGATIVRVAATVMIGASLMLCLVLATPLPAKLGRWGQGFTAWRTAALTPAVLLKALGLGLIVQSLAITIFAVLGTGLGIILAPTVWAVVVGLISVVLLLPITVAGIGLREGSLVAVLGVLGHSQSAALALSLTVLAVNLVGAGVGLIADLTGRDRPH